MDLKTAEDIGILQALKEATLALLGQEALSDEASLNYITTLSKTFRALSRDSNDGEKIRNQFGRINYKKGSQNAHHMDFESFGLFEKITDGFKSKLTQNFKDNWKDIKAELSVLIDNIDIIFEGQLKRADVMALCKPELREKLPKAGEKKVWKNFSKLSALFETQTDAFYLERLSDPKLLSDLVALLAETDPARQRYGLGRVLVVIGELAKNLSTHCKSDLSYFPLGALKDIRDLISHSHYKLVASETSILSSELAALVENFGVFQAGLRAVSTTVSAADEARILVLERLISTHPLKLRTIEQELRVLDLGTETAASPDMALTQATIARFEALAVRSERDQGVLDRAKKRLEKLQKSATPAHVSTKSREELIEESRKLNAEMDAAKLELTALKSPKSPSFAFFVDLERRLRPKVVDKSKPLPEASMKRHLYIKDIHKELMLLQSWLGKALPLGQRDYAKEQCFAAIGQYMRDLNELKDKEISEIQRCNLTLKVGIERTIKARNLSAHDPTLDHLPELVSVANEDLVPLLEDIRAMKEITADNLGRVERDVIGALALYYNKLGQAYSRLNLTTQAIAQYEKALNELSDEAVLRCMGLDSAAAVVLIADDLSLMGMRISIANNLAGSLLNEGMIERAYVLLRNAYELYSKTSPSQRPKVPASFFLQLGTAMLRRGGLTPEDRTIFLNAQRSLLESDSHNEYVTLAYNAVICLKHDKGDSKHALELIEGIDLSGVTDGHTLYQLYYNKATIAAEVLYGVLNKPIDTKILISKVQEVIIWATQAVDFFKSNQVSLKAEYGDEARLNLERLTVNMSRVIKNLAATMGSKATEIIETEPENALLLIKEALSVQRRHSIDVSKSLYTLANTYINLYMKSSLTKERNRNLQMSVDVACSLLSSFDDPKILAQAHSLLGYIARLGATPWEECFHTLQAAFYHMRFKSKDDDDKKDIKDGEEALTRLSTHNRAELLRYLKVLQIHAATLKPADLAAFNRDCVLKRLIVNKYLGSAPKAATAKSISAAASGAGGSGLFAASAATAAKSTRVEPTSRSQTCRR